ncbi:unnamed protein product [Blepharisma stoltei]|uniref:Transposase n=1 Tax=Blepharisma stoltei TaxID=1481888 RepID=A0AAU9IG94_9CILI|nr:unnamed protein product [Blepharisma stoltei]
MYLRNESPFLRCLNCNISLSVRRSSIFYRSRLQIRQIVLLIFRCFVREHPLITIVEDSEISRDSVIKLFKKIRALIKEKVTEEYFTDTQLGIENEAGEGHPTVEVDETHLATIDGDTKWLFGLYDRGTEDFKSILCWKW